MNEKLKKFDHVINEFWSDPEHFVSFMNAHLFGGSRLIKKEDLVIQSRKIKNIERDVVMRWDSAYGTYYLGIENQLNEDYSMPFRVLKYDFLWYQKQMDALAKKHDKEKDLRNEAFISKMQPDEKIIPCITIVIYYGEHFWKGNKDLYDLFINTNEHVNNYPMRLVELCKDSTVYDNDEINLVFEASRLMIQEGKDVVKLKYFQSLSKEVAMVIASMVKNKRLFDIVVKKEKGMVNMCESLDRWEKEIQAETEKETLLKMVKEMLEKGLSEEFILSFANINKRVLSQAKELILS